MELFEPFDLIKLIGQESHITRPDNRSHVGVSLYEITDASPDNPNSRMEKDPTDLFQVSAPSQPAHVSKHLNLGSWNNETSTSQQFTLHLLNSGNKINI